MMNEKTLNITAGPGATELIIREGQACPFELPEPVKLSGILTAPSNFLKVRKAAIDIKNSHVLVNRLNGKITLVVSEKSNRGETIIGTLTNNPELENFRINQKHYYSSEALATLIRQNRAFFSSPEDHSALMTSFSKFKAKIQTDIEKSNDNRGNTNNSILKTVDLNQVPLNFKINIPIFLGYPAHSFIVDIFADATDSTVRFWLDSVELYELITKTRDKLISEELKNFEGFVIIEQ